MNLVRPISTEAAIRRENFSALARTWEGDMLRLARRLTQGNDDLAQDLVQESLIRAYQAYVEGRFQEEGNAKAWLFRILTNLFINDYRRKQKWDAGVDLDTLTSSGETGPKETHASVDDVPGVALLDATLDEELEAALNTLSDGLKMCVVMVDMENMDYAEAAKALNIPVGTVRSRLSRARMQLHDRLYEYGRRNRLIRD